MKLAFFISFYTLLVSNPLVFNTALSRTNIKNIKTIFFVQLINTKYKICSAPVCDLEATAKSNAQLFTFGLGKKRFKIFLL